MTLNFSPLFLLNQQRPQSNQGNSLALKSEQIVPGIISVDASWHIPNKYQ